MKFRPEIHGLRSLAVVSVVLFHAGIGIFSGGFIGVDIFFVISGYLITSIVLEQQDRNVFHLLSFYLRRARRIIPALYVTILITTLAAVSVMLPNQLYEFGKSLLATLFFSSNFFFWKNVNYWGQTSDFIPLLHLWSLGIEEQFYLLFPLLFLLFNRIQLKYMILLIIFISLGGMIYAYSNHMSGEAFYLLPFRVWELCLGASAALWRLNEYKFSEGAKSVLYTSALIGLIYSIIMFDQSTDPLLLYGLPALGAMVIVSTPLGNGFAAFFLKNKYAVYLGSLSYSLYLFHQPILSIARIISYKPLSVTEIIYCLLITYLFAAISYKYIEIKFQNPRIYSDSTFISIFSALLFLLITSGVIIYKSNGLRDFKFHLMNENSIKMYSRIEHGAENRRNLWQKSERYAGTSFEENSKLKVLFVGDSLSEDLYMEAQSSKYISEKLQIRKFDFDDECAKNISTRAREIGHDQIPCSEKIKAFKESSLLKQADVIVLANLWMENAKYLQNFIELPELVKKKIIVYLTHSFIDMKSIILMIDKNKIEANSPDLNKYIYINKNTKNINANNALKRIADKNSLYTIDSNDFFCNYRKLECILFDDKMNPLILDQVHLSTMGIELFSSWLTNQLNNNIN